MLGCYLRIHDFRTNLSDPDPIFLFECHNSQGEIWLKKGCTVRPIGHALTCLQAALLLGNNIWYHFCHVETKSNVMANRISCISSESSITHKFPHLLAQVPSLTGYWRYLLNATIISTIMAALLQTDSIDPLATSRLLLTDPRSIISHHGATSLVSTTHAHWSSLYRAATGYLPATSYPSFKAPPSSASASAKTCSWVTSN